MGEVVHLAAYRAEHVARLLEQRIQQLLGLLSGAPEVAAEIVRLRHEIWLADARDAEIKMRDAEIQARPTARVPRKHL
jgi:hypothetical protein